MPVLPSLYRAAAGAAQDTRIIDARQLEHGVERAVEVVREGVEALVKRAPSLSIHSAETQSQPHAATDIARRQDANACLNGGFIAACYQGLNAGPAPGAVVGITLGAIAGFLLLLWLLYTLSSGSSFIQTSQLQEEDVVVTNHHRHRSRSPRRSSHRSSYREEMRQSTTPAPAPRRDRVVRQERISREIPRDVSRSRVRETTIVDESPRERRVDGDDVIEVIAEESDLTSAAPPPRKGKSGRRSSGYGRSVQTRSPSQSPDPVIESGYRRVDPNRLGGGGFRQHRV